ncbi:MAG TPA: hypothetical protein VFR71_05405 [Methyloceanibacter sp.]|nr:hypothetical protein [Methyloceanibacter sp.]
MVKSLVRVDWILAGGMVDKPTPELLILCDFAVDNLTTASAHVFYEIGVRHAAKPRSMPYVC